MAMEEDAEGVEGVDVEDKEEEWRWEKTGGERCFEHYQKTQPKRQQDRRRWRRG